MEKLRSHEVMDWKRCQHKWYWKWRLGLTPVARRFGALDLGTWIHTGFEGWYLPGFSRDGELADHFNKAANDAIQVALNQGAPEHVIEKAEELAALGEAMAKAYQAHYGSDPDVEVLAVEPALEFSITDADGNEIARDHLKPDMVYRDHRDGRIKLMENKTAATIRTQHLAIDGQARAYGTLAERALKKAGILKPDDVLSGITYNYLRKALPDLRPKNEEGQALNKNGTVSAKQQPPLFLRKFITLTRKQKLITLRRLQIDAYQITLVSTGLRKGNYSREQLSKTPHTSCVKFCDYWPICVADEEGTDIREMQRTMYRRENPYDYAATAEEHKSFEMG